MANSIHYHPASAFTYKNDWDFSKSWKMYYYVRNRLHIQNTKFSNKLVAFANYACFLLAMAAVVLVYQKTDKLKKLSFILWPAVDAVTNDFSQSPVTILQRLNSSPQQRWNEGLKNYIKYTRQAFAGLFAPTLTETPMSA